MLPVGGAQGDAHYPGRCPWDDDMLPFQGEEKIFFSNKMKVWNILNPRHRLGLKVQDGYSALKGQHTSMDNLV